MIGKICQALAHNYVLFTIYTFVEYVIQVAMCNFPTIKDAADVAIATMMSGIQVLISDFYLLIIIWYKDLLLYLKILNHISLVNYSQMEFLFLFCLGPIPGNSFLWDVKS